MVYGDFSSKVLFNITIEDALTIHFSYAYLWLKNSILLVANKEIYECNIHERKLQKIEMDKAKELYSIFFAFQKECQDHMPIKKADFINQNYIYLENYLNFDGNYNALFVDLKNNKIKKIEDINNKYYRYHDIVFHKGYFIIVTEKILTIIKDKKIYSHAMGEESYIFARVAGIDDNEKLSFIALEHYEGREEKSDRLVRYELS